MRSPQYRPREAGGGAAVWAIVCFTIDRQVRRQGVASQLLDAAVEYAFSHGATSVEAYAHASVPTDYMGHTELYRRAGFAHVRDANKRAVVRIER
jgi:ribosomal protein S18 acetylase RimI-like enzyme